MKHRVKSILCLTLALMLVFASSAAAFTYKTDTPPYKAHLTFGDDGKFTILNLSDFQEDMTMKSLTVDLIRKAVEKADPDLIVLNGDNIAGYYFFTQIEAIDTKMAEKAIDNYMSVLDGYGIPVAIVFGNHDAESSSATREIQMKIYEKYDCFIGFDEGDEVYGVGNYNVPIYSSDSTHIAFNLWMIDSGMYNYDSGKKDGYDYVHESQLEWYKSTSDALKAQNGGMAVPSIVFQHIVVPEVFDYLTETDNGWVIDEGSYIAGAANEKPCPSNVNGGEYAAMAAQGDVLAMVFGHDHTNTYEIKTDSGIDLLATPGCGFDFFSYGDTNRGCRVIELDESKPDSYETKTYSFIELFDNDPMALIRFNLSTREGNIGDKIYSLFAYVWYTVLGAFLK